jgi:hypothetical protein
MATITVAQGAYNTGYAATQMPVIQNLGPGILYLGSTETNLTTEGIQLPVGAVYELPRVVQDGAGAIWIQASGGTCDVRMLNVG